MPAEVKADIYGKAVVYEGRVAGLGAGTGSAFALLPAQNATGNWIKVVQRVPVRISLDRAQLAAYPLRIGLSMRLDDEPGQARGKPAGGDGRPGQRDGRGPRPGGAPKPAPAPANSAFADALARAIKR